MNEQEPWRAPIAPSGSTSSAMPSQLHKATDKAEGSVKGMSKTCVKAGAVIAGALRRGCRDGLRRRRRCTGRPGQRCIGQDRGAARRPVAAAEDAADDFTQLGAVRGRHARAWKPGIIDIGTALGIADEQLAPLAQDAAEAAGALALITDTDADDWLDTIGKAAGGSDKALKAARYQLSTRQT